MNIETEKEKICINKVEGEKTEVALIEGDVIVPDVKPDIISTINTCGEICIYKKEILDGKVRIDGTINTYIIYLTESENGIVRGLTTSVDFTKVMDIDECNSSMNLEMNTNLKNIECKVLNGRKINIKAQVEFKVKIYSNQNEEMIKKIDGIDDIQKQNKILKVNTLIGKGDTKVYAKDTIQINNTDNFAEILKVKCNIINKEYKTSYNKILSKADLEIKILYLTEDNRIGIAKEIIPAMGFIDIANVSEDNICDINYTLKNVIIKPNNAEEHSIYVEVEIGMIGYVYDTKEIELIEDLYNPEYNISFTQKDIEAITDKRNINSCVHVNEKINASEIKDKKILDFDVNPTITNTTNTNDKILYEGEMLVNILYETNNSTGIDIKTVTIPFNNEIECDRLSNNVRIETDLEVKNQDMIIKRR